MVRGGATIEVMPTSLAGRDLLSISDLDRDEISTILDVAAAAKTGTPLGRPLDGRSLVLIFQRPSNRTRVSFEVAVHRLGGHPIALFNPEVQLGERESASDISRILDRYADGIVARLVSHRDLIAIAGAADSPVINALTDAEHPCQVLADLLTVREALGRLAGARVTYIGDGNNVCTSWLYAAALTGVDFRVVCPLGYEPSMATLSRAAELRRPDGGFSIGHKAAQALEDTDIVYTDVWTSMGQEGEQQRRREDFAHLQVNDALLRQAPNGVRVMHCLPAHRGEEITNSVIDGPQSIVFEQAENRLWVQLALLALVFGVDAVSTAASDGATPSAAVVA
jgi:ornithine carbamoyltransferase